MRGISSQSVGPYTLLRQLGSGGMGVVYEAVHAQWQMRVALKRLHPSLVSNAAVKSRLIREIRAATHVRHPNVVRVFHAAITDDGVPYIVMELLEGCSLAALLADRGRLDARRSVDILLPIVAAMWTAHRAGIIHRDLKPGNIVMTQRGLRMADPVVTDFGTSKVCDGERDDIITKSDGLLGTIHYMAPEQTMGATRATAASDQYALAVILYECVTGRRPFVGESPYQLMHAIVTSSVPPMRVLVPDIDPELERVVLRGLARAPEARFRTVAEFGLALLPWASGIARATWGPELHDEQVFVADTNRTLVDDIGFEPEVTSRSRASGSVLKGKRRAATIGALLALGGACIGALIGNRVAVSSRTFSRADAPACVPREIVTVPWPDEPPAPASVPSPGSSASTMLDPTSVVPPVDSSVAASAVNSLATLGTDGRLPTPRTAAARARESPAIRSSDTQGGRSGALSSDVERGKNGAPILE